MLEISLITSFILLLVASVIFNETDVKLTTEGHKHFVAVIGSKEFKSRYIKILLNGLNEQLLLLSQIAQLEPQAAYSAFVAGFKRKLTCYLITIPDIKEHLDLLQETIRNQFIPAITGDKQCSNDESVLLSLPARYGGLGIPIFHSIAAFEYKNSSKIT